MTKKINLNKSLIVITLIGFLIRLVDLGTKSFWFDEAFSFFIAKQPLPQLIIATASDNHPPLYYLLLHFWMVFGTSEATLRLLSLIFGILAIIGIFHLGSIYSKKIGLISSLILAVSPLQVYYSQESRMYSLAILLSILCFYFFLRFDQNLKSKVFFTISLILGLYTHYFFILSLVTFNIFYVYQKRRLKTWLISMSVIFLSYLPWIIIFLSTSHPTPWNYPLYLAVPATFAVFAVGGVGTWALREMVENPILGNMRLLPIIISLLMAYLFVISPKKKMLLPLLFILLPILLSAIISILRPFYSPRSLIIYTPFYYLIIATLLWSLNNLFRWFLGGLLTFLCLLMLTYMHFNPFFWGEPLKIVSQIPFIDYQPGDAIAHASIYSYYPFRYYHQDKIPEFLVFDSLLDRKTVAITGGVPTNIDGLAKNYRRIWFVGITFLSPPQDVKTTVSQLSSKYRLVKSSTHNNIEIYLFDTYNGR